MGAAQQSRRKHVFELGTAMHKSSLENCRVVGFSRGAWYFKTRGDKTRYYSWNRIYGLQEFGTYPNRFMSLQPPRIWPHQLLFDTKILSKCTFLGEVDGYMVYTHNKNNLTMTTVFMYIFVNEDIMFAVTNNRKNLSIDVLKSIVMDANKLANATYLRSIVDTGD